MSEITGNLLMINMLCEMILQFILFLFVTLYGYKISIFRKIKSFNSLKFSAFSTIILSDMVILLFGQFTLNSQIIFYGVLIFSILCKFYGYFLIAIILKKLFSFILTTRVSQPAAGGSLEI